MDVDAILAKARAGEFPSDWNVWPLRRNYMITSAIKWGLMSVVGFVVLVPVVIATIPSDFAHKDGFTQSMATAILLLLGALAFSSLWLTIDAILRALRAQDYWLVITPLLFIKAEPRRIYSIPLEDIGDITLKGVNPPSDVATQGALGPQHFAMGQFPRIATQMGVRQTAPKRSGQSPSLAFRDRRDNRVITVGMDSAFDHLGAIEHILRERAAQREDALARAPFNR
ncbi:MAG TPA: hypothetical protein VF808_01250 [Ktedonobacterales bacterium]